MFLYWCFVIFIVLAFGIKNSIAVFFGTLALLLRDEGRKHRRR